MNSYKQYDYFNNSILESILITIRRVFIQLALFFFSPGTKFLLIDEDSSNDIPSIVVTFPDGHADRLMLRKHYFNEEDRMASRNECHFTGHLAHEKDACVSMTGCIGFEDILFTIISKHARDSPYFLWTKEGEVNVIESGSIVRHKILIECYH